MSRVVNVDAAMSANASTASPDAERLQKTLTELLDAGKSAQHHFEKAKAALASEDFAVARYPVAASLSHEKTEAAAALKAEINRLSKASR